MDFSGTRIFIFDRIVDYLIFKRRNLYWYSSLMECWNKLIWIYRCQKFEFQLCISWYFSYLNSRSHYIESFGYLSWDLLVKSTYNNCYFKLILFGLAVPIVKFSSQNKDSFWRISCWLEIQGKLFWIITDKFWQGTCSRFGELLCS